MYIFRINESSHKNPYSFFPFKNLENKRQNNPTLINHQDMPLKSGLVKHSEGEFPHVLDGYYMDTYSVKME